MLHASSLEQHKSHMTLTISDGFHPRKGGNFGPLCPSAQASGRLRISANAINRAESAAFLAWAAVFVSEDEKSLSFFRSLGEASAFLIASLRFAIRSEDSAPERSS